jgi:Zn-dependent M28 family amino/carboxypeptidase
VGVQPIAGAYERPFPVAGGRTRGTTTGVNVVGMIRGTRTPDHFVVVSAHYDHVGIRNGETFNGADDNASGTAALFAIGAHFSRMPPAVSLMLVAFDGEERGNVGSRAFVQQPPAHRDSLLLNLNADMIGRDPDNVLWVSGISRVPALKPIVDRVAARAAVQVRTGRDNGGREDWMAQSDQWSFIEVGIPALYVGVTDETHHHRPTDDYANMTHDFYVRAVETIVDLVGSVASAPDVLGRLRPAPVPSAGPER